jgi:Flp pilus assembly CpaF family ATPase
MVHVARPPRRWTRPSGIFLSASDAERIIRLVAAHVRAEVHAGAPILSAELPDTGERFEGVLPPIVRAPPSRSAMRYRDEPCPMW